MEVFFFLCVISVSFDMLTAKVLFLDFTLGAPCFPGSSLDFVVYIMSLLLTSDSILKPQLSKRFILIHLPGGQDAQKQD